MEAIEINSTIKNNVSNNNSNKKIKRIHPSTSYNEFFTNYLQPNQPCVIQSGITNNWPCGTHWNQNKAPNLNYLQQIYGQSDVPVANCHVKYFNAHEKTTMKMHDYINYWINYINNSYNNNSPLLYLKDWHCLKDTNKAIYNVPKFFASDWLNEYYLAHPELNDDYMFVYMGPKGSWTSFHVDVFKSYSWSANIVGKKRWLLLKPGCEKLYYDSYGNLPHDIETLINNNTDDNNNNNNSGDDDDNDILEIIQEPGEIVFVPSGYYHQVTNIEDTISINHNFINSCNIWNIWIELKLSLNDVMNEIKDCYDMDNWNDQCQLLLKASNGINYIEFYKFLYFILTKRIDSLNNNKECCSFDKFTLGYNHCIFDIKSAKYVLDNFIEDVNDKNIFDIVIVDNNVDELIEKINDILLIVDI